MTLMMIMLLIILMKVDDDGNDDDDDISQIYIVSNTSTQIYMVTQSIGIRGRSSVVESGRLVLEKL